MGTVTGNGTYPATITVPDDGGSRNAASVGVGFEGLANRTSFHHAILTSVASLAALKAINTTGYVTGVVRNVQGIGWYWFDSAGSGTEVQPHLITPTTGGGRWKLFSEMPTTRSVHVPISAMYLELGAHWSVQASTGGALAGPGPTVGAGTQACWIPNSYLHDGATLSSVDVIMRAHSAHTALPSTQPKAIAVKYARASGQDGSVPVSLGAQTTASFASIGVYDTGYEVEFSHTCTTANVIDVSAWQYAIEITDESGTNSATGNIYWGFRLNFTNILPGRWP